MSTPRRPALRALMLGLTMTACGGGGDSDPGGSNGGAPGGAGGAPTGGTGGGAPSDGNVGRISYLRDIKPIFNGLCIDCHYPGSASEYDLNNPFDPVKGVVGRDNSWTPNGSKETKIVDPGNVANSFIIRKVVEPNLDGHIDGSPMPLQLPRLTEAELAPIRQWIMDGAKNDQFFTNSVAPIFGTAVSLGRGSGRCTFCHFPNAPSMLSVLDVFDPAKGMVGRASRYGGMIIVPGDPDNSVLWKKLTGTGAGPQMPLHRARLFADQVQLLRDWIAEGAEND